MSRTKSMQKRNIIIEAAKHLFLSGNYLDVSMAMISQQAGVSKNTLYSHFNNKEMLFKTVLEQHWHTEAVPKIDCQDTRSLEVVLTEFALQLMRYLYQEDSMALFRILVAESGRFPDLAQSIVTGDKAPILLNLTQYLSSQSIASSITADQAAIFFLGLLKEDAFWHVLAGFRRRYSKLELSAHIAHVIKAFVRFAIEE